MRDASSADVERGLRVRAACSRHLLVTATAALLNKRVLRADVLRKLVARAA